MKIATHNSTLETNSTSLESHDFSIGDVSTIIDILRNRLYSNPIQTLTQEYLSNARDSHRESKQKRPITVTLPTKLDSVLKIRDYGVGLDKQRVRDVFVNYGISTKRSDNTQTGGFGLGAKSAWAYTDSFCVVSYFNGKRCTYVAHTGRNKNGTFELIDESDTTEPNGVEVQIPVKENDIYKFVNAVYRTTFFWETKPELQGITQLEVPKVYSHNEYDFQKNKTTVVKESEFVRNLFNTGYNTNKIFALIDGIPYDLSKVVGSIGAARRITNMMKGNYITFISVNNGDISVAASREEISSDESNVKAVTTFCEGVTADIVEIVLDEFNRSFDSLQDYVETYERMTEVVNYHQLSLTDEQKKMVFRYTENGIEFTFDLTNNYTCDKFAKIKRYRLKKKRIRHYLEIDDHSHVSAGSKAVVVINDQMFANSVKSQKIRALLGQSYETVYEVDCKEGYQSKLQTICKARLMSELQYTKQTYNRTTGRVKEDDEVQIRSLYTNYGNVESNGIQTRKVESLADDGTNYVLVPFTRGEEKFNSTNNEFVRMVEFINNRGWSVVKCGKRDYALLSELDNFHEYDEVVENIPEYFPIRDEVMRTKILSTVNSYFYKLRRYRNEIVCPMFTELFEMYPDRLDNSRLDIHEDILDTYYPSHKKFRKEFEQLQKLETKIQAAYPLLRTCYQPEMMPEYIVYINAKHETKKK
jgi:hypothetical protein